MTASLNPSKRSYEENNSSAKRVKTDATSLDIVLDDPSLSLKLLADFTIEDLGMFALICKKTNLLAFHAFNHKELGFNLPNCEAAKEKLQRLFSSVRQLKKEGRFPPGSILSNTIYLKRVGLSSIFRLLAEPSLYQEIHEPTLDLLELNTSWEKPNIHDQPLAPVDKPYGVVALYFSAFAQRPRLIKLLLEHDVNPSGSHVIGHPGTKKQYLPTPLHSAIAANDVASTQLLLAHQAPLNIVFTNRTETVRWLPPYVVPPTNALQYALGSSKVREIFPEARLNIPILKILLEKGAQITLHELMDAIESHSMETIHLLISLGAKINAETATLALSHLVQREIERNSTPHTPFAQEIIPFLLEHGAKMYPINDSVKGGLHHASEMGDLLWVQYLVEKGADMSIPDQDGLPPLHIATRAGSLEVVRFMLENGADVNQGANIAYSNYFGDSEDSDSEDRKPFEPYQNALIHTCLKTEDTLEGAPTGYNHIELVKLLLSYKARIDLDIIQDEKRISLIDLARQNQLTEIVQLLRNSPGAIQLRKWLTSHLND